MPGPALHHRLPLSAACPYRQVLVDLPKGQDLEAWADSLEPQVRGGACVLGGLGGACTSAASHRQLPAALLASPALACAPSAA